MHRAPILALALVASAVAAPAAAQETQGQTYEHTVYLHEYSGGLHILPERINAKVGDTLVLTVLNQGASSHNLRVCGDTPPSPSSECQQSWGQTKFSIAPNESVLLTIEDIPKAGTFEYYCYIPGHKSGGMVGELIVQGDAEESGVPGFTIVTLALALGVAVALARRSR